MTTRRSIWAGVSVLAAVALLVPSCGGGNGDTSGTLDGVGRIPGNDFVGVATLPPDIAAEVSIPEIDGALLGAVAKGNRLLMIGDSILSSIAKRYGNEACGLLVPQGWNVALEAEAGQFVDFGLDVLDKRWNEGWDAVVIELGTNYAGSKDRYRESMEKILDRIGDTPVVLANTTVFRAPQKKVNAVIDELVERYPNATLLDWAAISKSPSVLSGDRIHPTPKGRVVLATAIARAAGVAPTSPGDCMKVYFQDDSRVLPDVMPGEDDTTVPPSSVEDSSATIAPAPAGATTTLAGVPTTTPATTIAPPPTAAATTLAPAPTTAAPQTTVAVAPSSSAG
ncbi:MAG: SGNH/GDSL hydrolase family protein [Actinomycetota bacterium]